jgi:hypothetical protein
LALGGISAAIGIPMIREGTLEKRRIKLEVESKSVADRPRGASHRQSLMHLTW